MNWRFLNIFFVFVFSSEFTYRPTILSIGGSSHQSPLNNVGSVSQPTYNGGPTTLPTQGNLKVWARQVGMSWPLSPLTLIELLIIIVSVKMTLSLLYFITNLEVVSNQCVIHTFILLSLKKSGRKLILFTFSPP